MSFVARITFSVRERFLRQAIESDQLPSMIFGGPLALAKQTLALLIASTTGAQFARSALSSPE